MVRRIGFLPSILLAALVARPALAASTPPPATDPLALRIAATISPSDPLEVKLEARNVEVNKVSIRYWRFGDDSPRSTEPKPTHRYAQVGKYVVRLRYSDAAGVLRTLERRVNLISPPSVTIAELGQVVGAEKNVLWFRAEAKSAYTRIDAKTATWTFGGGGTAMGERVEHRFEPAGLYTVRVTAQDDHLTIVSDEVEVSVKEVQPPPPLPPPPPPPAPLPPPTTTPPPPPAPEPPPPPPVPTMVRMDFEVAPTGIDGVALAYSTDPAFAHRGTGSLAMNLRQGAVLYTAIGNAFVGKLMPFLLSDAVHANWFSRWDAPLSFDASRLRPTLEQLLAATPQALTPAQTQKLWMFVQRIERASVAFPKFDPGKWYCLGVTYVFPKGTNPGMLEVKLEGGVFLRIDGLSVLDDGPIVDVLLKTILAGKVVVTDATLSWLDDLRVSSAPLTCQ